MAGKQVLVFANGEMPEKEWAEPWLADAGLILAADGGTRHALALGQRPDIVIGDLDSFAPEERAALEEAGTHFLEHPRAKDETDLELALLYAVRESEDPILIFAGLGGRLDQMFANILLLMHPDLRHRSIRFVTQYQQIWLVHGETVIAGEAGDTVSLIPLGGDVHVERTSGLQWQLEGEVLSFGPARGLSNVMTDEVATVRLQSGHLLCIHTKQAWQR